MPVGTMTSKGQITIPREVREDLGLVAGSKVSFTRDDEGNYVLTRAKRSVLELAGSLPYDGPPLSLEDMEAAIAAGAMESNL